MIWRYEEINICFWRTCGWRDKRKPTIVPY